MFNCRIYFDNVDSDDFVKFMRSATEDDLYIEQTTRELPGLSAEIAGLLVGGMTSAVALLNIVFTYFSQRKSRGEIIIVASNGRSLRYPSDISEEKKKEMLSLFNDIESMQVTVKLDKGSKRR